MILTILSLLICAIEDYKTKSFYWWWLILPSLSGVLKMIQKLKSFTFLIKIDFTVGLAMSTLFLVLVIMKKMGLGDFLIYLVLGFNLNFQSANLIFFFASLIFIINYYFFKKPHEEIAFVPDIFLATILVIIVLPFF